MRPAGRVFETPDLNIIRCAKWVFGGAELSDTAFGAIQDGGLRPNWTYFSRNNCTGDCSISLKFGTWAHYGG